MYCRQFYQHDAIDKAIKDTNKTVFVTYILNSTI